MGIKIRKLDGKLGINMAAKNVGMVVGELRGDRKIGFNKWGGWGGSEIMKYCVRFGEIGGSIGESSEMMMIGIKNEGIRKMGR